MRSLSVTLGWSEGHPPRVPLDRETDDSAPAVRVEFRLNPRAQMELRVTCRLCVLNQQSLSPGVCIESCLRGQEGSLPTDVATRRGQQARPWGGDKEGVAIAWSHILTFRGDRSGGCAGGKGEVGSRLEAATVSLGLPHGEHWWLMLPGPHHVSLAPDATAVCSLVAGTTRPPYPTAGRRCGWVTTLVDLDFSFLWPALDPTGLAIVGCFLEGLKVSSWDWWSCE